MTATLSASAPDPAAPTTVPTAATPLRPRWELPFLAALLLGTAVIYLWNLSASGWGNTFYAAAVQAGTQNWTAFFFGSLDSANAITVDKPPASLWVMALSGRIFGFSSWSMLAPQALMAVGAVALLWATVRRVAGPGAALLAGAVLALTPVAVMMFRFNNPDALLVLLLVAAAWATTHAVEKASTRWLLLAGVFLGFGFLTKMLQAFLVVPGLAAAYLWAAPTTLWRRVRQLLAGGVAIVVSAGWWLLTVALWPVDSRPYIGGSTNNSPLELAFGYNGLGRIFGGEGNGGGARRGAEMAGGFPGGAEAAAGGMPGGCRPVAAEWAASAARPGSPGCSTPRSAARSPGCCPPP
jgi:4-amino-4-deoxy-L-arabinose transferase-like glycosyltransferase